MLIPLLGLLAAAPPASAMDPVVEPLGDGFVNWTALELDASATGLPPAGGAMTWEILEDDARGRLGPTMLALSRKLRFDAHSTFGDLLAKADDLSDRLDDNLSLWDVYESRYYTSGSVQIDGSLSLQDLLRPALVRAAKGKDRTSPPTGSTSGLVIDARGLALHPCMAPELRTADGTLLYGIASLTEAAASARGPVVYVRDPADVVAARRAGAQPLFVRAMGVVDEANLTVSDQDAAAVRTAAEAAPFLLTGSVVIVVDSP